MRQIVITINIEHDELSTYPEAGVASILSQLKHMSLNGLDWIDGMALHDINGNTVGKSVIKTRRKNCLTTANRVI
jgi:hypothetical protein